jgi:hypothetical protein
LYTFLSSMRATCPAHLIRLDLLCLMLFETAFRPVLSQKYPCVYIYTRARFDKKNTVNGVTALEVAEGQRKWGESRDLVTVVYIYVRACFVCVSVA